MRKSPVPFFAAALILLALDQLTKYYVETHIGPYDAISVTSFFRIVYAENIGSAFGLFKSLGSTFFILVSSAAVIALSVMIVKDTANRLSYSLLLGGAAGNLLDRLMRGYVVDFLDFHLGTYHWPAFNVADSALTAGILFLFYYAVIKRTD